MSITPGGNPVCPTCDRSLCICCPDEQRIVAAKLRELGIGNEPISTDIAGQLLNALNLAGYQVVFADFV